MGQGRQPGQIGALQAPRHEGGGARPGGEAGHGGGEMEGGIRTPAAAETDESFFGSVTETPPWPSLAAIQVEER